MSGRYLLDTTAAIALFKEDEALLDRLADLSEVLISIVALGELFFGAQKSQKVEENLERVEALATSGTILPCDLETARAYGIIRKNLQQKGRPIPQNDMWIAATALQYDLILLHRDTHFDEVDDISTETW